MEETDKPTWRGPDNEEFTPTVEPADVKALWNIDRDYNGGQRAIGSVFAKFLSPGANLKAVHYRMMMLQLLSRAYERLGEARPEVQKQAERFLNLREKDAFFAVMARIPLRWPKGENSGSLPFDLEQFLDEAEREAA